MKQDGEREYLLVLSYAPWAATSKYTYKPFSDQHEYENHGPPVVRCKDG
jgi:hypothetical protein